MWPTYLCALSPVQLYIKNTNIKKTIGRCKTSNTTRKTKTVSGHKTIQFKQVSNIDTGQKSVHILQNFGFLSNNFLHVTIAIYYIHIDLKCQNYYIKSAIINSADFRSYSLNKFKKYITRALDRLWLSHSEGSQFTTEEGWVENIQQKTFTCSSYRSRCNVSVQYFLKFPLSSTINSL